MGPNCFIVSIVIWLMFADYAIVLNLTYAPKRSFEYGAGFDPINLSFLDSPFKIEKMDCLMDVHFSFLAENSSSVRDWKFVSFLSENRQKEIDQIIAKKSTTKSLSITGIGIVKQGPTPRGVSWHDKVAKELEIDSLQQFKNKHGEVYVYSTNEIKYFILHLESDISIIDSQQREEIKTEITSFYQRFPIREALSQDIQTLLKSTNTKIKYEVFSLDSRHNIIIGSDYNEILESLLQNITTNTPGMPVGAQFRFWDNHPIIVNQYIQKDESLLQPNIKKFLKFHLTIAQAMFEPEYYNQYGLEHKENTKRIIEDVISKKEKALLLLESSTSIVEDKNLIYEDYGFLFPYKLEKIFNDFQQSLEGM